MTRSLLDSSIEMEFLVLHESSYFSHHACKILRATDVKVISENVAKVLNYCGYHHFELSLRFRL